ncbi:uncharacterized protein P174DRAFT_287498 [Aspergillus novofumigatus IBT 16806]|uniref:C2H2-type domain-containing protein n=1 Tax=Aspergillus novofumigatus (strain IBT 16806) TaxID=1392255 RepID=A0A2I1BX28_ASPN1|nr:uncharacterized protein P174DRAFT_287498 [Aspergillus novofumigatus IBT 16806]PKX89943.1 hypothetical protein P174DRAFT_287498 [Aspergillus novofumigatus IBT 16806]
MGAPSYSIEQHEAPVGFFPSPTLPYQSTALHQWASHWADRGLAPIVPSSLTGDAALGSDVYNSSALLQSPTQLATAATSRVVQEIPTQLACQVVDRGPFYAIAESSNLNPVNPSDTTLFASEIAHAPSASGIAQSPFQPIQPKPTQQQSPEPSPAALTKPFRCKKCPKSYGSQGAFRRHDVGVHGVGRRTGGRPSNNSRRLI